MATMTVKIEPEDIVQETLARIRPYLERSPVGDRASEIIEDALHLEDGWWYVPVRLHTGDRKAFEYYDRLTDVEDEIKEREHLNVLFVPSD